MVRGGEIMAKFLTELDCVLREDSDCIWVLRKPLVYFSDLIGKVAVPIDFPVGGMPVEGDCTFETDFASVPRVPVVYTLYGDRAHREAVIHDYLYRVDSVPVVSFSMANRVFLEAMKARGKPWHVRYPMYVGVCIGGCSSYHKRKVHDKL
jgi:hypothetical protein